MCPRREWRIVFRMHRRRSIERLSSLVSFAGTSGHSPLIRYALGAACQSNFRQCGVSRSRGSVIGGRGYRCPTIVTRVMRESELVGESAGMRKVRRLIQEYGPSEAAVLISGETGTGKELVARGLHRASPRAERPFIVVNCAAISDSLFEAELFGSLRGAYTGSTGDRQGLVGAASGGTFFLDEVGELPAPAQAKRLRLLEGGTYRSVGGTRENEADVRTMAATNRHLPSAVEKGEFRSDLPAEQLAKSLLVFGAGMLATSKVLSQEESDSAALGEFALGLLS